MKINLVIGTPITQSISPAVHAAGYLALGIDNDFAFWALDIKSEKLAKFFEQLKSLPIRGISVTVPHKTSVIEYLSELTSEAKKIGAVNTIVKEGDLLIGYNTDWMGIAKPLETRLNCSGKTALVIGAGGAARSALYALQTLGAITSICNRTKDKALLLADEFLASCIDYHKAQADLSNFDIVINTTSLGMLPNVNTSALIEGSFRADQIVFDCVYNPLETKFLQRAKLAGAQCINGLEMFLEQAYGQFEIYTGHKAPKDALLLEAKKALGFL